jgi:hypothetical protein
MIECYKGVPKRVIQEYLSLRKKVGIDTVDAYTALELGSVASMLGSVALPFYIAEAGDDAPQLIREGLKAFIAGELPDGATDEPLTYESQIDNLKELRQVVQTKVLDDVMPQLEERGYIIDADGNQRNYRLSAIYAHRFLVAQVEGSKGWTLLLPEGSFPSMDTARRDFFADVPRIFGGGGAAGVTTIISSGHFVQGLGFPKKIPVIFFSLEGLEYTIHDNNSTTD